MTAKAYFVSLTGAQLKKKDALSFLLLCANYTMVSNYHLRSDILLINMSG